jgi:hypothetical protein
MVHTVTLACWLELHDGFALIDLSRHRSGKPVEYTDPQEGGACGSLAGSSGGACGEGGESWRARVTLRLTL